MSDDICGAECHDGSKCQHPAGWGTESDIGPCKTHDPTADVDVGGREFTLSEDDHKDLLDAARVGKSLRGCARSVGVSHNELRRYLDAHDSFRTNFARARGEGERKLIEEGLRDADTDSSMVRFLLARSFDYVKTERREHRVEEDADLADGWDYVTDAE